MWLKTYYVPAHSDCSRQWGESERECLAETEQFFPPGVNVDMKAFIFFIGFSGWKWIHTNIDTALKCVGVLDNHVKASDYACVGVWSGNAWYLNSREKNYVVITWSRHICANWEVPENMCVWVFAHTELVWLSPALISSEILYGNPLLTVRRGVYYDTFVYSRLMSTTSSFESLQSTN